MKRDLFQIFMCCLGVLGFFLLAAGISITMWTLESNAFNKLTGKNTTWMDAAILELRVQESVK